MTAALLAGIAVAGAFYGCGCLYLAAQEEQAAGGRVRRELGIQERRSSGMGRYRAGFRRTGIGQWVEKQLGAAHLHLPALDVTVGCLILWLGLIRLGTGTLGLTAFNALMVASAALAAGARFYLRSRRGWLVRRFNEQLPEVAWMMGNAVRAGMSIPQSFALVGREAPKPAGPIFQDLLAQLELNRPLKQVLDESQTRWRESREYRLFVLTLLIQYRAGGNLAGALEELSRTLSDRKGVNEEVRSATAGPRSAAMTLPFMPVVAAATMNLAIPGFLNPVFSFWGLLLVVPFALVMWLAATAIRQFSEIKV